MNLKTRLVISLTVLLLAVIGIVGVVASQAVENILVAQTDRTLLSFVTRGPEPRFDFDRLEPPLPGSPLPEPPASESEQFLRPFAEIFITADGTVVRAVPSGFADDPDPLPDVTDLTGEPGLEFIDGIDGRLRYRANTRVFDDGAAVVYAAPLRDVATAKASLIRALLLAGGGVLLVGAAATWWTVRRATRPVDDMVDTAEAIAGGDLARRVADQPVNTEIGRLGNALNEMLSHIEHAVASEREGRERLRRFVADASHELRTPVTTIAGYAELHREGGLDSAEAEERAWSRIESESRRMGSLIEELLTLARLGQNHPLHLEPVDLVEVARDAAADHAAVDSGHLVELAATDAVLVSGDRERLDQVVSNLLSNIRVHTPEGTRARLEVSSESDAAVLTVTDDGPGIPDAAVDHVFDRFYRADPSRSRRSGGSGLGLAIVEAIVTAHGGTVAADNVEGSGLRITVRLPLDPGS